jgi:RecB family exonuclease
MTLLDKRLPENFLFSQGSLQDYMDCRRRFQLRYLVRLAWPAVRAEPVLENERMQQAGARFHRLAQQLFSGLLSESNHQIVAENTLNQWWRNLLAYHTRLPGLEDQNLTDVRLFPEITLTTSLGNHRLVAKYDLVAVRGDDRLVIFDWKTSTRRPARKDLMNRKQTHVYPYLLVRVGNSLSPGTPVSPDQVEMIYWFTGFPDKPEHFPYNQTAYAQDERDLLHLVDEIESLAPDQFFQTPNEKRCLFCEYRSLCDRGREAGELPVVDEFEDEIDLDFSAIEAYEY